MFKKKLPFLLLIFLVFFTFLPAIGIKFSWIDDGWDILMAQKFINSAKNLDFRQFFNLFLEGDIGRFRPVYWLWQTLTYLLAGKTPLVHYFLHFLLILGIIFFIYKIVFILTKNRWAGFFSGALFLLNTINPDNWYRLGPQEPLVGFFITSSVFLLLRGKNQWWPIFLLVLALFSKETALAILPPVVVFYLGKRFFLKEKNLLLKKYVFFSLELSALMMVITLTVRTGYTQNYSFDVLSGLERFWRFLTICIVNLEPFSIILIFTFLIRQAGSFIRKGFNSVNDIFLAELLFGVWFISFLAVQSPWTYTLQRYLLPATIGFFIFLGIELSQVAMFLQKRSKKIYKPTLIIFILFFTFYLSINLISVTNNGRLMAHNTANVQKMVAYLAKNSPPSGQIFLNFLNGEGTMEFIGETAIHLDLFYGRPDIKVAYLNLDSLPQPPYFIVSESNILPEYKEEEVEQKLNIKAPTEMKYYNDFPVITTPANLLKQVFKKTVRRIFNREEFTAEGIYTTYYLRDNWKIYAVN